MTQTWRFYSGRDGKEETEGSGTERQERGGRREEEKGKKRNEWLWKMVELVGKVFRSANCV